MSDVGAGEGGPENNDGGPPPDTGGQEVGGKPDFLPEKFWNAETKQADLEGLSTSYNELGEKVRVKSEDLRKGLREEFDAEKLVGRPETADAYDVRVPDSIAADMSEDMNFEFSDTDPMLAFWKEFAFEQGYDQEKFDSGVAAYIQSKFSEMPNMEKELEKLGDNGRDRSQHINLWAQKSLSPESYSALESFATTADGVMALEEIMRISGEPAFSPGGAPGVGSSVTLNELRSMQADPRYWDPAKIDPEFVKKVDAGYVKLVS